MASGSAGETSNGYQEKFLHWKGCQELEQSAQDSGGVSAWSGGKAIQTSPCLQTCQWGVQKGGIHAAFGAGQC